VRKCEKPSAHTRSVKTTPPQPRSDESKDFLHVLVDMSSGAEAPLQTASDTGVMQRDDVVSKRIQ
jgi:hypothetical protein